MLIAPVALANPSGVLVVLVPINPGTLPGAFGTNWTTTLWVHNASDVDGRIECAAADPRICPVVKAHTTAEVANPYGSSAPFFLRIPTGLVIPGPAFGSVSVELRTTDSATAAKSAGTEIPIARPSDFHAGTTVLPQVPVNDHSRLRIRVFAMGNGSVTVHGIGLTTNQEIVTVALPLTGGDSSLFQGARSPSYAEALLSPPIAPDTAMRVEFTSTLPIWGFVSITDNVTQQFTIVSPRTAEYVPISVAKQ